MTTHYDLDRETSRLRNILTDAMQGVDQQIDELLSEIGERDEKIGSLEDRVDELESYVDELEEKLAEAQSND